MGTSELSGKPDKILGVTCDGLASHLGGVAILLVASCYGNQDKLLLAVMEHKARKNNLFNEVSPRINLSRLEVIQCTSAFVKSVSLPTLQED